MVCILYIFQPGGEVSEKVLKSYCWMYSTFNIPREFEGQCARKRQSENPVYNSYYQWVSIFLIFQAFLFYCPRIIWIMSEGGNPRTKKVLEWPTKLSWVHFLDS